MPPQAVCNHVSSPFIGDVWVLAHVDDDLLEASLLLLRFSDVLADGVLALRNSNVLYLKASVEVGKSYDLQTPCLFFLSLLPYSCLPASFRPLSYHRLPL